MFPKVSYSLHDVTFTNVVRNIMILLNLVTLLSNSLNWSVTHCINFYLGSISSNYPICSLHIHSTLVQVLCTTYSSTMFPFPSAVNTASTLITL